MDLKEISKFTEPKKTRALGDYVKGRIEEEFPDKSLRSDFMSYEDFWAFLHFDEEAKVVADYLISEAA